MSKSNLAVFEFKSQEIRTVIIDCEIWFVAKDVCSVLQHSDVSMACKRLDDDEKLVQALLVSGQNRDVLMVSESGLYSLVLTSRKPEAKAFKKWITSEVLPSIRKTGSYSVQQNLPSTYKEALLALVAKEEEKERLEAEKALLEHENHALAEAVDELFDYSSIIRIAKFNNVSETLFSWRVLKGYSLKMGLEIKRVPCPRFQWKLLYSHDVCRVAYPNYKLPETTTLVIKTT